MSSRHFLRSATFPFDCHFQVPFGVLSPSVRYPFIRSGFPIMSDPKNSVVDLAILGFDEIRDLAKESGIPVSGQKRAELVAALRQNGIGTAPQQSSQGEVSHLDATIMKELLQTVNVLVKEMAEMKEELFSLRGNSNNPVPVLTTTPSAHTTTPYRDITVAGIAHTMHPKADTVPTPEPPTVPAHVTVHTPARPASRPPKTTVMSYYQRPPTKSTTLRGASRTKCKALYVGNVHPGCSADSIEKWCSDKKVQILKCSVSETKYYGTAFAHVVIAETDFDRATTADFWPDSLRVREWRFASDRITSAEN